MSKRRSGRGRWTLSNRCPFSAARICQTCTSTCPSTAPCRRCPPAWRRTRNRYEFYHATAEFMRYWVVFFCQSAQLWMQQNGRLCVKRFTRYFVAVLLCAPSLTSGIFSWIYLMSVLGVKVGFCRSVPTRIVQENTKGVRWPRRHRHFVGFCPAVAANGSQRAVMRNLEISENNWEE